MKRSKLAVVASAAVLSFTIAAHAGYKYIADSGYTLLKGEVDVNVPGMDFAVEGSKLQLTHKGDTVTITVQPGDLSTDLGPRDSDMRKKIMKEKPVTMSIDVGKLKIPTRSCNLEKEGDCPTTKGKFTLGGKTRTETVSYKVDKQGSHLLTEAAFSIKLTEYGVSRDTVTKGPVEVGNDVKITARFKVAK